jgi:outer membrane protein assembly factor BamD
VRRLPLLLLGAIVLVSASQCSAQILHKKKKVDKSTDASNTAEPDKQLYDKAISDIKHGKHEVGRLGLQTLINTYPDSEYLAKAKLAIADSYFKEGGTANITQAIAGYKDFIVFFPFLPEAAYAQMQVAMANYNEMAKADRDNTHARASEEEFQTFLTKYPKDPLAPQAQQRLREVQEIIADGQYRIAYYYYLKGDKRAAAGRLIPLTKRYPLYSKSDTALWMLGDIFEKSERKDIAGSYYGQIVRNYPLSTHAPDAKAKLKAFNMPIPQPDAKAVAWMTAEQNAPRPKETVVHRSFGMLHSGPDVHAAALSGVPTMEAESDTESGTDILKGGGRATLVGGTAGSTGTPSSGVVATVKPGEAAPAGSPTGTTGSEDVNSSGSGTPESANTPPATGGTDAATDSSSSSSSTTPAATDGSTTSTDAAKTDGSQTPATTTDDKNQKESSSKKKGLKKILPW